MQIFIIYLIFIELIAFKLFTKSGPVYFLGKEKLERSFFSSISMKFLLTTTK